MLLEWILYDLVMLRKFQTWSDCHGGRPEESGLTKDEILNLGEVTTIAKGISNSSHTERGFSLSLSFCVFS